MHYLKQQVFGLKILGKKVAEQINNKRTALYG